MFTRFKAFALFFVGVSILLSGCAIAPLTQGGSARPAGKGGLETSLQWSGYSNSAGTYVLTPVVKARYGLSSRTSLTALTEFSTLTANLDYNYYQSSDGSVFAGVEAGFVLLAGDVSYGVGHTVSFLWEKWEPFFKFLVFQVNLQPGSVDMRFFEGVPDLHGTAYLAAVGTRYWVTPDFALGLHGSFLISSKSVRFEAPLLHNFSATFTW